MACDDVCDDVDALLPSPLLGSSAEPWGVHLHMATDIRPQTAKHSAVVVSCPYACYMVAGGALKSGAQMIRLAVVLPPVLQVQETAAIIAAGGFPRPASGRTVSDCNSRPPSGRPDSSRGASRRASAFRPSRPNSGNTAAAAAYTGTSAYTSVYTATGTSGSQYAGSNKLNSTAGSSVRLMTATSWRQLIGIAHGGVGESFSSSHHGLSPRATQHVPDVPPIDEAGPATGPAWGPAGGPAGGPPDLTALFNRTPEAGPATDRATLTLPNRATLLNRTQEASGSYAAADSPHQV